MKIKHILSCMLLCTVLSVSNGYTADKYIYIQDYDKLNGKIITIYESPETEFHNKTMCIYTKPDNDFKPLKVHKYFGDPKSETVTINKSTNHFDQFSITGDNNLEKYLSKFNRDYNNVRYGIAEYDNVYYLIILCDNVIVDGQVCSTLIAGIKYTESTYLNHNSHADVFTLQRVPIVPFIQNIEDIGEEYNYFLITNNYPIVPLGGIDGNITFYPKPSENFKKMQVLQYIYCMDRNTGPNCCFTDTFDNYITVFNKNGEFAIDTTKLENYNLERYNQYHTNLVKFGILKYNSAYYLVEYMEKNNNVNKDEVPFDIFPFGLVFDTNVYKFHCITYNQYQKCIDEDPTKLYNVKPYDYSPNGNEPNNNQIIEEENKNDKKDGNDNINFNKNEIINNNEIREEENEYDGQYNEEEVNTNNINYDKNDNKDGDYNIDYNKNEIIEEENEDDEMLFNLRNALWKKLLANQTKSSNSDEDITTFLNDGLDKLLTSDAYAQIRQQIKKSTTTRNAQYNLQNVIQEQFHVLLPQDAIRDLRYYLLATPELTE